MTWWNSSWSKRKQVNVTETSGATLTDYQTKITVTYDSDMKSDFSDLRFTNSTSTTELDYWIESYTASSSAVVWVKIPSLTASSVTHIYMYYGNSGASSTSSGGDTFILFDDFTGTSPWTEVDPNGHISEDRTTNHRVDFTLARNERAYLYQAKTTTDNIIIDSTMYSSSFPSYSVGGFASVSDTIGSNDQWDNGYYTFFYDTNKIYNQNAKDGSTGWKSAYYRGVTSGTTYYSRFTRKNGYSTFSIYSDASRTTLVGSSSLIEGPSGDMDYFYAVCSRYTGAGYAMSGWISDIKVFKYASSLPTYTFGSEEVASLPLKINIGDSWKDVDSIKINIGDSWKTVASIKQNIGDSWKTVF